MKIAVFTDAHLQLPTQPHLWELLGKPITGYANWQRRKHNHSDMALEKLVTIMQAANPDYFLFLGDAVNLGLKSEWEKAKTFFETLCPREKLIFLPGNHDFYTHSSAKRFSQEWGNEFPILKEDKTTRLIGLSSAITTRPFNACGKVSQQQLDALDKALQTPKKRIVALHHPPVEIVGGVGHKRLINLNAVQEIIQQRGAELVVHGHTHRKSEHFIGKTPVVGLPSASHINSSDWLLI
jgi:3',5'-cyclic AMP phosphodiesterase CpdA